MLLGIELNETEGYRERERERARGRQTERAANSRASFKEEDQPRSVGSNPASVLWWPSLVEASSSRASFKEEDHRSALRPGLLQEHSAAWMKSCARSS